MGQLARRAYQNGQFAELAVALDAESIDEFAGRIAGIQAVAQSQNGLFDRLAVDRAELAAKRAELEAVRAGVAEKKAAAAAQVKTVQALLKKAQAAQARVARLVAARAAALGSVQAARAQELRRAAALKAEQRRVAALIAARTSRGSGAIGGELAWPVPGGGLTMRAGPRIHPVYGYRSCHTGIDIGGGYGARIVAPAAGTVVATYSSDAYGSVTVVDHGNGLSTFFAHQSSRSVGQGQRVSRGQTIGYTGTTGWVTGPHLHFEVHVNGQPFDPLGWLGMGSKRAIVC
ncbi:MAG: M23 family metallopeptidase [Actinomycetia bacterium]|nr:M23 family metallopeptidase [Actinomycetes bacterium]